MITVHHLRLGVVAVAWGGLVLLGGLVAAGGEVGYCLGGVGPAQRAAIAACHEAARYAHWGPLASPVAWVILAAVGWLAIGAIDARRHRRSSGER